MIPRRPGRPGRSRVLLVSLAALTLAALAQSSWHPGHHGPPWDAPAASSQSFRIGGTTIQVDFAPGSLDLPTPQIMRWVENAASAVSTYYGRFPVSRDRILIQPIPDRSGVLSGTTWGAVGGFPAFSRMRVGQHTDSSQLTQDWMMTHELVHTAFPSQSDEHHWIEEGIAVYVEPIARVQNGLLTPEKIWSDMVRDMPKGSPQPGDRGLDRTPTWGRTYWGGAQFCLLADVTLREQTHNRFGLQDALRAIANDGGTIDQNWPIEKALKVGDRATGTHVLERLYASMKDKPVPVDLDSIWKKLGIIRSGEDQVRFDDAAPEADIRQAITKNPPWGRIAPDHQPNNSPLF